ncbi:MAG TPA: tetratricopeptide repeat protein, partial [Planctomycetaceae bacterium]|nr:tetratricopeptide repeat protein [Planctomycetaceae bacterium]
SLLVEKIPFLMGSVAFCAVAVIAQSRGHSVRTLVEMPLSSRVLNAILAASLYLQRAAFPFGLAIFYPHPGPTFNLTVVALAVAVLSAITLFAIVRMRRWPFLLVGWLWFLGTLVPMIGLVQVGVQQMADRYAYFPNLGLYLALAWLVPAIVSSFFAGRRALPALAGGLVAVYAATAFVQVGYWRDSMTLITHSLEVTGENAFGQTMLGDALFDQSRIDEALAQYQRAIELEPRDPISHAHLGDRLHYLKRFGEAANRYRVAVQLDEGSAELHVGLGLGLHGLGQYEAARREFERALELDRKSPQAHAGLALLSRTHGDFEQSTLYAERALQLDDEFDYCERLIAWNLFDQGHREEAIERLRHAAAAAPRAPEIHADLALVLSLTGEGSATMRQ